jgi:hypothetical protein
MPTVRMNLILSYSENELTLFSLPTIINGNEQTNFGLIFPKFNNNWN